MKLGTSWKAFFACNRAKTKSKPAPVLPFSYRGERRTPTGIPATAGLRYLLIMTPNIFSLIQGIHALKERTPAALQQLFRKHDSELL